LVRLPYPLVCLLLGLALGWLPKLLHGPIPEKFNLHYIWGAVAVWAYYAARLTIGFWVGISAWPRAWWLRGPLCGLVALLPVTLFSLAVPECGPTCMAINLTTGTGVGLLVGGLAFVLTGKHHS
jgi:hypothetical protein